jgi:hypothetical protein
MIIVIINEESPNEWLYQLLYGSIELSDHSDNGIRTGVLDGIRTGVLGNYKVRQLSMVVAARYAKIKKKKFIKFFDKRFVKRFFLVCLS